MPDFLQLTTAKRFSSPNATTAVKRRQRVHDLPCDVNKKQKKINVKIFSHCGTKVWNEQIDRHENKNSPFKQHKKDVTRR